MLKIPEKIYDEIIEHVKLSYPHECCGALIGKLKGGVKTVSIARAATNENAERAADRYEISPAELNAIDKEARTAKLDIVGIYHSHPDHPDEPSEFDRNRGFPFYSYLIVAVEGGTKTWYRSWTFEEDEEPFSEEPVEIV